MPVHSSFLWQGVLGSRTLSFGASGSMKEMLVPIGILARARQAERIF